MNEEMTSAPGTVSSKAESGAGEDFKPNQISE